MSSLPDPQMRSLLRRVSSEASSSESPLTAIIGREGEEEGVRVQNYPSNRNQAHLRTNAHVHYNENNLHKAQYGEEATGRGPPPDLRNSKKMMQQQKNDANEAAPSSGSGGYGSFSRRQSTQGDLFGENAARRLSEAGVNRRPSAVQVLTEDTDSFMVGQSVYVDGVTSGRIQFIGETKFGPGEWAGIVLDEPLGKNDGSVARIRYFQCQPGYGIFSRLFRLTAEPIEGASTVLSQMRKYGYEIADAPLSGPRRGSVGSGGAGSRRGSLSVDDRRGSIDRGSASPRSATPELRHACKALQTSDLGGSRRGSTGGGGGGGGGAMEPRRSSLSVPERRGSMGTSPMLGGRRTPGRSPLASPSPHRAQFQGVSEVRIEKDPEMTRLAQEARRLSMGNGTRRTSGLADTIGEDSRQALRRNCNPGFGSKSPRFDRRQSNSQVNRRSSEIAAGQRRSSETPSSHINRRTSESLGFSGRRGSEDLRREVNISSPSITHESNCEMGRRPSSDLNAHELERRRLSEAGLRRPSTSDAVLNDDTSDLMVGLPVWVDGTKLGRIAFLGEVHFAKGEMAGVHLERPVGKNNGTVGGIMYFQCEPKHGLFARLHRLTREPIFDEKDEYDQ